MALKKILFFTKDGYTIAADIDVDAISESQRNIELEKFRYYFSQKNYDELSAAYDNISLISAADKKFIEKIDAENSKFLMTYIKPFNYRKQRESYENKMNPPAIPSFADKEYTIHFNYNISEDCVPEFVRQLGFKIVPKDEVFDITDLNNDILNTRAAEVDTPARKITFFCNHYRFKPDDYNRLKSRIQKFEIAKMRNPHLDIVDYALTIPDAYERKLFDIYAQEQKFSSLLESYVAHETHHIKNRMILDGMYYKKDAKRLTAEDTYKISVENERSAYLAGTIYAINAYLKKGDLNDFSMFDNKSQWLKTELLALPENQRISYVSDMDKIVNGSLKFFEATDRANYDADHFKNYVSDIAANAPMDVPEDTDHRQYDLLRRSYYSMSVWNPQTGRMEVINLAQYIKPENEIVVSNQNRAEIIEPCRQKLQQRKDKYNQEAQSENIDTDLLDKARKMQRDGIKKPVIVSDVQTFNINSLYDEESQENSPDNHSEWSDCLKEYWQGIGGYSEICKNNNEYKFKVGNDTVKYTSPRDVSLSKKCKYSTFVKLLEEPTNKYNPVNFLPTLNEEQKLLLYVACINSGRKTKGEIPTNLGRVANMREIPQAEREKFAQIINRRNNSAGNSATRTQYNMQRPQGYSR